jgi:uncharacterized repeat protein (TIGR04138 family)
MTLCDKCRNKDATVFLTQTVDGDTTRMSFCEACAAPFTAGGFSPERLVEFLSGGKSYSSMVAEAFDQLAASRPEYSKEAFVFVREAVDHAVRSLSRESRHVTVGELLEALRLLAIERYGFGARDQLASWGITRCEDFGEIVFTLIDSGVFGKQPEDKKEDFANGYDFAAAFPTTAPSA